MITEQDIKYINGYKCITVDSMTGDCPDEWIEDWKEQGFNLIHFTGNGCNDYTLMDQVTEIKF